MLFNEYEVVIVCRNIVRMLDTGYFLKQDHQAPVIANRLRKRLISGNFLEKGKGESHIENY
ncbi:hypothetical protein CMI44_01030 [Candidatus Pacearchaeota archaeon]|jgi:hypothetical protein|nr:hypothetical protein [Candidatus Pacearchaeota archaeon]|tara:strand:+ start:498 stop:680 length:183 start_codon:yes stop_codon:yes gene_type:complete